MEVFIIRALQLILSLSILVLIHEFGHFIFSRIFGVRVEKFYMFFNPLFSIVRIKKIDGKLHFSWFSRKVPEKFSEVPEKTEFGIGWVPLGGYCSISGMIDESMNVEQMKEPEKPWEFRSKPAWQRLLIMAGGVLFNFILALVLYAAVLNVWGEEYLPLKKAPMGMDYSTVAQKAGFVDGDILLYADDKALDKFDENMLRTIDAASEVTVLRNGKEAKVKIPENFILSISSGGEGFATYRFPTVVKDVSQGSTAKKIGLQQGDSLTAINGVACVTFFKFSQELSKYKDSTIQLTYFRNGVENTVPAKIDENGKLGFFVTPINEIFETTKVDYSFFKSIPAGISKGIKTLTGYASDLKYMFTKEGAQNLGGFGAIGSLFPKIWSWQIFWETTAFLSIILAFMNILPIPALDGGHILFLFVEVISGRKPGVKFLEYAQMVGMFLLLALLVYANGNDLYKWLFK
jgi:regulator of sigma E protease